MVMLINDLGACGTLAKNGMGFEEQAKLLPRFG
jgi:hypothetical protein